MSTIKVDTLVAADGSSAVTLTKQSAAKAYIDFQPSGIQDSSNFTSITDEGTGQFQLAITNNMSTQYMGLSSNTGNRDDSNAGTNRSCQAGTNVTSAVHHETQNVSTVANIDPAAGQVIIHGDLA